MPGIHEEFKKFVDDKVQSGQIVHIDWAASEFLETKNKIDGEDLPFYKECATHHVANLARKISGRYSRQEDKQQILPGFEQLLIAYPVRRGEQNLLVPIHLCTDQELLDRADEYDKMAVGCRKHARELRKYVLDRKRTLAA